MWGHFLFAIVWKKTVMIHQMLPKTIPNWFPNVHKAVPTQSDKNKLKISTYIYTYIYIYIVPHSRSRLEKSI